MLHKAPLAVGGEGVVRLVGQSGAVSLSAGVQRGKETRAGLTFD